MNKKRPIGLPPSDLVFRVLMARSAQIKGEPTRSRYTLPNTYGDVLPVDEFRAYVRSGAMTDIDGFAYPSNGTHHCSEVRILPSTVGDIPPDATHVIWYNR